MAALPDKLVYSETGLHFAITADTGEAFFLQLLKNTVIGIVTNRTVFFISFKLINFIDVQ